MAGALLVQEAGGKVASLDGEPLQTGSRGIVAGNAHIARQLHHAAAPVLSASLR